MTSVTNWISTVDGGDVLALAGALSGSLVLFFGLVAVRDRIIRHFHCPEGRSDGWRSLVVAIAVSTWRISLALVAVTISAAVLGVPTLWLGRALTAVLIFQAGLWAVAALGVALERLVRRSTADRSALAGALSMVRTLAKFVVWSVVAMVLLANLGVDITALLAGLGIGGIAIGLAAQGIFADLFASLSIVIDRPFVRGDFVIFDDVMGTIEKIGIKSTRIRSLSGEEVAISNAKLLGATIRNYQLLRQRRITFAIGVVYQTPIDEVKKIPNLIKRAIEAQPKAQFDRAHFKAFGDSALEFEAVYFVRDADYNVYMDVQQAINLEILAAFAHHGVQFAYPTRTLIIEDAGSPETRSTRSSGRAVVQA